MEAVLKCFVILLLLTDPSSAEPIDDIFDALVDTSASQGIGQVKQVFDAVVGYKKDDDFETLGKSLMVQQGFRFLLSFVLSILAKWLDTQSKFPLFVNWARFRFAILRDYILKNRRNVLSMVDHSSTQLSLLGSTVGTIMNLAFMVKDKDN